MWAFGVGGPSVDTVLASPHCRPGEHLSGDVRIAAADFDVEVQQVTLGLVTRVESERAEGEGVGTSEFHRLEVSGSFQLRAGASKTIPFRLPVPWETPVTEVYGQHLHGMTIGVRTELAIAKAVDKGDLDEVSVRPTSSQQRVLEAFSQPGFQFKGADVELGQIYGAPQQLPFYQEIEFYPPPDYQGSVNEVELTFVAGPGGLMVVLEADKRGGMFHSGTDAYGRFHLDHDQALHADWATEISGWLQSVADQHCGGFHTGHGPHGNHDPNGKHGHHDEHGHRGGPGWGGAAAGVAAGFVGGMVAGEVLEEVFEEVFEDDED
ncbi:sporulation protein [Actinomadura sp. HBU206391]|uniref:sporulation protein n=1 Tax=Actinomadura sp. HBU206391 TaxID=2731692 RepID=UPI00164F7B8C|nr:sporulation protein [Actinomadura sp. HBU206391]MBC6462101.1 sporulation protein [Actinomadura sp. HBU206391]